MSCSFTPRPLPSYAVGGSMYQIFLRQFTPEGTIRAAEKMLPHLASLGIRIAYLCPINEADDDTNQTNWSPRQIASGLNNPKNPYRMNDYFKIDSEYGTDEDLRHFIQTAHKLGLKIMLDLVYIHCGPKANLLSMEPEMIQRDENGTPLLGEWKFPLLNFKSEKLREYMWENMLYYVKEFDIDGYRCDVGAGIPIDFWEEGRRRIDAVKPDFFMLNESTGMHQEEVFAFETVYGFRHRDILSMACGKTTPLQFRKNIDDFFRDERENIRIMWFTDNHDVSSDAYEERMERIAPVELNETLLGIIFTLEGMPLLYNGQEIADSNRHSIWANHEFGHHLGINWSDAMTRKGKHRLHFVKEMIALRLATPSLAEGKRRWLNTDCDDSVLAYERIKDNSHIVCIFNVRNTPVNVVIPGMKYNSAYAKILMNTGAKIPEDSKDLSAALLPYSFLILEL